MTPVPAEFHAPSPPPVASPAPRGRWTVLPVAAGLLAAESALALLGLSGQSETLPQ